MGGFKIKKIRSRSFDFKMSRYRHILRTIRCWNVCDDFNIWKEDLGRLQNLHDFDIEMNLTLHEHTKLVWVVRCCKQLKWYNLAHSFVATIYIICVTPSTPTLTISEILTSSSQSNQQHHNQWYQPHHPDLRLYQLHYHLSSLASILCSGEHHKAVKEGSNNSNRETTTTDISELHFS